MVRFTDGTEVHKPHTISFTATLVAEAHLDETGAILSGWSVGGTRTPGTDVVDTGGDAIAAEIAKAKLAGKQVAESRIEDGNFARETWDEFQVDGHRLPNTP